MTRGRWVVGLILLVAILGVALLTRRPSAPSLLNHGATPTGAALTKEERRQRLEQAPEAHLADNLNHAGNTLQQDLAIVGSLIAAYRSNYPSRGNPIGDNREITDTFLGTNPNGIIFLRAGHPAINARGELCDRWGTPFVFHAESGRKMEVRSAGPDRRPWTNDDVTIVP